MQVAHPHSGCSSTWFLVELEFGKFWFLRKGGKPEYPEKNHSEQGREPTTNSTSTPGFEPGPHWLLVLPPPKNPSSGVRDCFQLELWLSRCHAYWLLEVVGADQFETLTFPGKTPAFDHHWCLGVGNWTASLKFNFFLSSGVWQRISYTR